MEVTFHKLENMLGRGTRPSKQGRISACTSDTFPNRRVEKMHSSMDVGCRRKRLRQRQLKEGNEAKRAIEHVGLRIAGTSVGQ